MKKLLTALALGLLLVAPAYADNITTVREGQSFIPNPNTGVAGYPALVPMAGVDGNLLQHELRTDASGYLSVRETYPAPLIVRNMGISGYTMAAHEIKRGIANVSDAVNFNIIVQTALADSDTTAIIMYVYTKETSNLADGLDAIVQSTQPAFSDSSLSAWSPAVIRGWFIGTPNGFTKYYPAGDFRRTMVPVGGYPAFNAFAGQSANTAWGADLTRTSIFNIILPPGLRAQYLEVVLVNLKSTATTVTVDLIAKGN